MQHLKISTRQSTQDKRIIVGVDFKDKTLASWRTIPKKKRAVVHWLAGIDHFKTTTPAHTSKPRTVAATSKPTTSKPTKRTLTSAPTLQTNVLFS
jgi:hypothetical protein